MAHDNSFKPVRRKDRKISAKDAWQLLISPQVSYGFLGTHGIKEENNFPYVVPMNFVASKKDNCLYLHSTASLYSKRLKAIQENNKVTFVAVDSRSAIDPDPSGIPCNFSTNYMSVMVFGKIRRIADTLEKVKIMNFLMKQKAKSYKFKKVERKDIECITVWKLEIIHLSGKKSKRI